MTSDIEMTPLTENDVSRLLRMAATADHRVVDQLLDRLSNSNAAAWVASALELPPLDDPRLRIVSVTERGDSIDALIMAKDYCKQFLAPGRSPAERLRGTFGYAICVARGLIEHDQLLSTQPTAEIQQLFIDLADVTRPPFADLFHDAGAAIMKHTTKE